MKTQIDIYDLANNTLIVPSSTWLYYRQERHNDPKVVATYWPYNINLATELQILRDAMIGDVLAKTSATYNAALVRFGWVDKGLNSLRWIPLAELVQAYKDKTISKTNRTKLSHICRLLFISLKDIK